MKTDDRSAYPNNPTDDYEVRVRNYENQGMTRSDAQSTVDVEVQKEKKRKDRKEIEQTICRPHGRTTKGTNPHDQRSFEHKSSRRHCVIANEKDAAPRKEANTQKTAC